MPIFRYEDRPTWLKARVASGLSVPNCPCPCRQPYRRGILKFLGKIVSSIGVLRSPFSPPWDFLCGRAFPQILDVPDPIIFQKTLKICLFAMGFGAWLLTETRRYDYGMVSRGD